MEATEHLRQEHRVILSVLGAFERYLAQVEGGGAQDHHSLSRFMMFFREYGDLFHHEKEESVLLPAMVDAGVNWEGDMLKHTRREHRHERNLMRDLWYASCQRAPWSAPGVKELSALAREFIDFQRHHLEKEETLLFPAAEAMLDEKTKTKIVEGFQDFERVRSEHDRGQGWLESLRQLAADLESEFCQEQA